jgi:hypothetical protein
VAKKVPGGPKKALTVRLEEPDALQLELIARAQDRRSVNDEIEAAVKAWIAHRKADEALQEELKELFAKEQEAIRQLVQSA